MTKKIKQLTKHLMRNSFILGLVSLFWLLYRSGTKPSRITYPCQKAAAANVYTFLICPFIAFFAAIPGTFVPEVSRTVKHSSRKRTIILVTLIVLSALVSSLVIYANFIANPLSVLQERTTPAGTLASVSVVHVENNQLQDSLETAINQIGGIESLVPKGAKVLIKLNIVRNQAPPDTVNPDIVKALINIVRQRSPSVMWVGDGSGEQDTLQNMVALGYSSLSNEPDVELVDLNVGELADAPVQGGGVDFNSFSFSRKVVDADVFISLACMKTHNTAVVTLGMKNLVGIAPSSVYGVQNSAGKWKLHERAAEKGDTYLAGVIVDLNRARKINLTIIDGRVAMEGEGPHDGTPVNLGLLIAGRDPVATDSVASTIMGFDPEKVPMLKLASEKGIGTNDLHKIEVRGASIEEVWRPFTPAKGHEIFLMFSGIDLLFNQLRTILIFPAAGLICMTFFSWFRFRRVKKKPQSQPIVSQPGFQASLDTFQPLPPPHPEERRQIVPEISVKHLENDVDDDLKEFQSYVRQVKETSLRLDELTKLLKSGEISENAYKLILHELGEQLSLSVEDIFKLRENLELARAKAKLEWAKEKVGTTISAKEAPELKDLQYVRGYKDVIESDYWGEAVSGQKVYSLSLEKWEELIFKIEATLSSLPIEEEAAMIEQYLSLVKEKIPIKLGIEDIEKALLICQQRLSSISERWASIRRVKIEDVMNQDLEASKIKDEIKELEVRFSVGELEQAIFEHKVNELKGALKKVEDNVSVTRSFIDYIDMKIFRASELVKENP